LKLVNLARVKHELFSGQITGQNLSSSIKGVTMSQIKVKNFGPIKAGLLENGVGSQMQSARDTDK